MARKKRKVQNYSFLIVPDNEETTRSFKLSALSVKIIFIGAILLLAIFITAASTYWKVASVALDYTRLEEENFELRSSIKRVEGMKGDLAKIQKMNNKIRETLTGYVQVDNVADEDSTSVANLDFTKMAPEKRRTIFNFIPSVMPVEGFITRGFEVEDLSVDPHYGLDIAAAKGSPVKATADGTVIFSGWTLKSGYILIIKHEFGYTSLYKHNQRNLVEAMEKVKKGQVIALVGNTGEISSGAHSHFEVWKNGQPLNPLLYVSTSVKN